MILIKKGRMVQGLYALLLIKQIALENVSIEFLA